MNPVSEATREFAVIPADRRGLLLVTLIAEGIPLGALAILGATTGRWDALLWSTLMVMALSGVAIVLCARAMASLRVTLGRETLIVSIGGRMFRHAVARTTIRVAQVHTVDLAQRREHAPRWRTLGIGIPLSLAGGYHRLPNGAKAFCLITDRSRVTVVPTAGITLLLSLADPQSFKQALLS